MWNQVTSEVILVVRTYAFFNRNNYILTLLVVALAGVVAYQLYVDTLTQWILLVLPFLQETGPCLPMSKPHSAHLLGFFVSAVLLETGRCSYDWWPCSPPPQIQCDKSIPCKSCQFSAPVSACVCSRNVLNFFSTWTL
ncbi:hypothetical protein BC835DRAFT_1400443 [Cytidiella melzeri]|nr:hypothetical protein BC835DRAFT_1400443 [Cytidiella melzeri]